MTTRRQGAAGFAGAVSVIAIQLAASAAWAGPPPGYVWVEQLGGPSHDHLAGLAADSAGNVVIVGIFRQSIDLGGGVVLTAPGDEPFDTYVFLAKFDSDRRPLWARQFDGRQVSIADLALTSEGDAVIAGTFERVQFTESDSLNIADAYYPGGAPRRKVFLARYGADGNFRWARDYGGSVGDGVTAVAVFSDGSIACVGEFAGQGNFGGATLWSYRDGFPSRAPFAAVMRPDGAPHRSWKVGGSSEFDFVTDVEILGEDTLFVSGAVARPGLIGGRTVSVRGSTDAFVARFNREGVLQELVGLGSSTVDDALDIAVDAAAVYVTGAFGGEGLHVGEMHLPSHGGTDGFLGRFDHHLNLRWLEGFGGPRIDEGLRMVADPSGGALVRGFFRERATIGGTDYVAPSADDANFTARFDADGAADWVLLDARGRFIRPAGGARLVVGGSFEGTQAFGTTSLASRGEHDVYYAALDYREPPPDRFEPDDDPAGAPIVDLDWAHDHERCPRWYARLLPFVRYPDARCPGIFEDGIGPPAMEESWDDSLHDLTLGSGDEVDYYRLPIPDPAVGPPSLGHADIRPIGQRIRFPDDLVPLVECGLVQRKEFGPEGRSNLINISVTARLDVEIVPESNTLIERAVGTDGESLRLPGVSSIGSALHRTVHCPRTRLGLDSVLVSFGERSGERSLRAAGGYRIVSSYRIDVRRGVPDWVFEEAERGGFTSVVRLPCPSGSFFPACSPADWAIEGLWRHPSQTPRPDCIADGPGCLELFLVDWPGFASGLDLQILSETELVLSLLDASRKTLSQATTHKDPSGRAAFAARLSAPDLPVGLYVLSVRGAPGTWSARPAPVEDDHEPGPTVAGGRTPGGPLVWILLAVVMILVVALWRQTWTRRSG